MQCAALSATLTFPGGPAWWALLGAVPLAIHLLARRRSPVVILPTARFLAGGEAGRGAARRWRDRLIMMLRCLMLALLGLAAAGPVWIGEPTGQRGDRLTVILLDASASMQAIDGHLSRFEQARALADAVLADAGSESRATVVRLNSGPVRLATGAGLYHVPLRTMLSWEDVGWATCDPSIGIQTVCAFAAEQIASGVPVSAVDLHIISDFQASQWSRTSSTTVDLPVPLNVSIHAVGEEGNGSNVAVEDVAVIDDPQGGLVAEVTLHCFGTEARHVPINVSVRRWEEAEESAEAYSGGGLLEGGATATWRIALPGVERSEALTIEAEVNVDDLFAFDNRLSVAVLPESRVSVLLVSDARIGDGEAGVTAIHRALMAEGTDGVEVERSDGHDLVSRLAEGTPDVVILCEASGLGDDAMLALASFVQDGGGLWWIADSAESTAALAQTARLVRAAGSPTALTDLHWEALRGNSWRLPGTASPQTLWFASEAARSAVEAVEIIGPRAVGVPQEALRLIEDEAGVAVLVMEAWGRGRAAALLHGLGREDSSLSREMLFAGLVHDMASALFGAEQRIVRAVVSGSAGVPVNSEVPTADPARDMLVIERDAAQEPRRVQVEAGHAPGLVLLRESGMPSGAMIVTTAPSESEPENLDTEALRQLRETLQSSGGESDSSTVAETYRPRQALWPMLLTAALALAICESGFLALQRRRAGGG